MAALGTALAGAQARPAEVVLAHVGPVPERAVRVADEAFLPVSALASTGWSYVVSGSRLEVSVNGQTARTSLRTVGGSVRFPVIDLIQKLGGEADWDAAGDTLTAFSPVRLLRVTGSRLEAETALEVRPTIVALTGPNRVVVDLFGARLTRASRLELPAEVTAVQFRPHIVRVTLPTQARPKLPDRELAPTARIALDLTEPEPEPEPKATTPPVTADPASAAPPISAPIVSSPTPAPVAPPVLAEPPALDIQGPTAVLLTIKLSRSLPRPPEFSRPEPAVLEIRLPGAQMTLLEDFRLDAAWVQQTRARTEGNDTILRFELERPLGIELNAAAGQVSIQLLRPRVGDGKLAGKVVVLDPGHGGTDPGAVAPDRSVREKDIVLAIGKRLSRALQDQGATVIMTRNTDVFIPLRERSAIANRNRADFFISIHINSNRVANTASGIKTFYHGGRAIDQLLADVLHREIVRVGGMPDFKVWSDRRIYNTGFSVLRNATMPAALLELGFINHSRDRARMRQPEFHQGVADAVVRGLKVFLGNE